MTGSARASRLLAVAVACLSAGATARAQEWRAGVQYGRIAHDFLPGSATSEIVLGLQRADASSGFGISAGIPVANDAYWGVFAARKRFDAGLRLGPLLDLSGHAFLQHDARPRASRDDPAFPAPGESLAPEEPRNSGQGIGGDALVGAFAAVRRVRFEARVGATGQTREVAGVSSRRVLPVGDARVALRTSPLSVVAEARAWDAEEGRHAYAGASASLSLRPLTVWGSLGEWVEGGVDDVSWSAGGSLALGNRLAFEVTARGNAFDPLYRTESALSVMAGLTVRLGPSTPPLPDRAPIPARYENGRAQVRVRAADAPGCPAIAGDFTGWKPSAMRRDGDHCTFEVDVAPGVYHYAFVAKDGSWFVPESVPGRQSDGMGGWVAVLVVNR